MERGVFVIHLGSTFALVGLIWVIQILHYPLFGVVGSDQWDRYHPAHTSRITWIVAPLMLAELITAIALFQSPPAGIPRWAVGVGLALVGVNWLSTAVIQVPLHNALGAGFDSALHQKLVLTNWIRTAAWTARGFLVSSWIGLPHDG